MPYKNILVTVDGSKLSELALQHVVRVADSGAHVHILSVIAKGHVSEVASLASALAFTGSVTPQWPATEGIADPRVLDARQKYVTELGEWLAQADFNVTYEAITGEVVETILEVAQRGFDIIVMATHGRTGVSKMVLGSVAAAVLDHAPCPVLIIPAHGVTSGS
jgi:nucleotide-binding universal stress UspA family protein